jgi:NHL repeat
LGGELNDPGRIAVDAAGNVYVPDISSHRVQKYDSSGNFLRLWGKDVVSAGPGETGVGLEICVAVVDTCKLSPGGAGAGEFVQPSGIATDASGSVYVAEFINHRIQKFDSTGNFERAWGDNVVSAGPGNTGTGFEICIAPADTCKAGGNGSLGGEMTNPVALATDTAGNLYEADQGNFRIQKFTADPAPVTTIAPRPGTFTTATPSFQFSSSDAGSTFECSLDAAPFAACVSPLTTPPLADGTHQLRVRATDPARQVEVTPASRSFTVDTTSHVVADTDPPESTIAKQPKRKTTKRKAKFAFSSDEPGATFECALDKGAFEPCGASAKFKVKPGKHKLQVRAIDAAGNVDQTPAQASWKVKRKRKHH